MGQYRCQRGTRALQDGLCQLLKLLASHAAAEVDVVHEALHIHRRLRDGAQHLFQLRANHIHPQFQHVAASPLNIAGLVDLILWLLHASPKYMQRKQRH